MDFDDDFDFVNNDVKWINPMNDHQKEVFDFPIYHSTPSLPRSNHQIRSVDFPSMKKHYGIVTFLNYQWPIIYRLMNDSFYIPYIRFSYVLHIFEHSSYKKCLVNIRNLPLIEMTETERVYYNQLSSFNKDFDWSNSQLLSVSMLDGTLIIIDLTQKFSLQNDLSSIEWRETLDGIREETRNRWILDEKIVLTRLKEKNDIDSTCVSSTNMAKRRSFFEQRLDLSIVDEAGGFVQIDSFIYPFIRNPLDNQIYINLNDIQQNVTPFPSSIICYSDQNSPMYCAYNIVIEQAQLNYEWNRIRHGRSNDLSKILLSAKGMEENFCEILPFLPLQSLLHLLLNKNFNFQFIQLFETSSLDEIELNYKNNVGRQFIMKAKRQGGLVNDNIPCLIISQIILIPSETKTRRIMTNDERLYLNIILLYYGLWKKILTKKKQWYLKEINENDKENINIEILSDNGK